MGSSGGRATARPPRLAAFPAFPGTFVFLRQLRAFLFALGSVYPVERVDRVFVESVDQVVEL